MKINNTLFKFEYDGSKMFSMNPIHILEDIINTLWNNGLPFISAVMLIKTENIVWVSLFLLPALFTLNFRITESK